MPAAIVCTARTLSSPWYQARFARLGPARFARFDRALVGAMTASMQRRPELQPKGGEHDATTHQPRSRAPDGGARRLRGWSAEANRHRASATVDVDSEHDSHRMTKGHRGSPKRAVAEGGSTSGAPSPSPYGRPRDASTDTHARVVVRRTEIAPPADSPPLLHRVGVLDDSPTNRKGPVSIKETGPSDFGL